MRQSALILIFTIILLWQPQYANGQDFRVQEIAIIQSEPIAILSWSPLGNLLVVVEEDSAEVSIRDPQTYDEVRRFGFEEAPLQSISWKSDGKYLVALSLNGFMRIWDVNSGQNMLSINTLDLINVNDRYLPQAFSVAWDVSGNYIAVIVNAQAIVVDLATEDIAINLEDGIYIPVSVAWSPDGTRLAVANLSNDIGIYSSDDFHLIAELVNLNPSVHLQESTTAHTFAWSPDSEYVVTAASEIQIRNAETGLPLITIQGGHSDFIRALAWSPDGDVIVTVGEDESIVIWDASRHTILSAIHRHEDVVTTVSWHPDGNQFVTGSLDGTIRVWEVN